MLGPQNFHVAENGCDIDSSTFSKDPAFDFFLQPSLLVGQDSLLERLDGVKMSSLSCRPDSECGENVRLHPLDEISAI